MGSTTNLRQGSEDRMFRTESVEPTACMVSHCGIHTVYSRQTALITINIPGTSERLMRKKGLASDVITWKMAGCKETNKEILDNFQG